MNKTAYTVSAETLRHKFDECEFMSIERETVQKELAKMGPADYRELAELLRSTIGEEERYRISPADTRRWTFFVHGKAKSPVVAAGNCPDIAPFNESAEVESFEVHSGVWALSVADKNAAQRGKWCAEQVINLKANGITIASMLNNSDIFHDAVVICPVIGFARAIKTFLDGTLRKTSIKVCEPEDFACLDACAKSEKKLRILGVEEQEITELTEKYKDLNRLDTDSIFRIE